MITGSLQSVPPVPRIFISHSSKDQEFGKKLVKGLRQALGSIDAVWYDSEGSSRGGGGLVPGDSWWSVIKRELVARNFFLVILSPYSIQSEWVDKEIDLVLEQRQGGRQKRIIPLFYGHNRHPNLQDIHGIDFSNTGKYSDSFHKLTDALGLPIGMDALGKSPTGTSFAAYRREAGLQRSMSRIHAAFGQKQWSEVLREAYTLIQHIPGTFPSDVYSMQGQAYLHSSEFQPAEEALNAAFALLDDTKQQFDLLLKYIEISYEKKQGEQIRKYTDKIVDLWSEDTLLFETSLVALRHIRSDSLDDIVQKAPEPYLTYTGHKDSVRSIAWWPLLPNDYKKQTPALTEGSFPDSNKKYLASVSKDSVQIWECSKPNGRQIQRWDKKGRDKKELPGEVFSVAWSPDGKQIATACDNGKVYIWQISTATLVSTLKEHTKGVRSVAWSYEGNMLASGSRDGTICLWDVQQNNFKLNFTFKGHTDWVNAVAWSPDNSSIASASSDGTVRIWDISTKTCRLVYREHHKKVRTLLWSRKGKTIASAGDAKEVHLWESATGTQLFKYEKHNSSIIALARSPHSRRLASAGKEIHVWNAATGDDLFPHPSNNNDDWIRSAAWSDDGRMLAIAGDDRRVQILELGSEL